MNKEELKEILRAERFDPRIYSLEGGLANDTICLAQESGRWCVYYTERGNRFDERWFASESEACEQILFALRRLPESQSRLPRI